MRIRRRPSRSGGAPVKGPTRAIGLVEVLIACAILACVSVPLLALVTSGRRTTEFNVRRLQAIELCRRAIDGAVARSAVDVTTVVSTPEAPVTLAGVSTASSFDADLAARLHTNFRLTVETKPVDGTDGLLVEVIATVRFRLSPAAQTWHRVDLRTLVVHHSPL